MNSEIVSKIAVWNPYLQGGHTETAEMESTARFIQVAQKCNIDVKVCKSISEINDYHPNFIFSLTYQVGKLTKYPTYVNVNIPISMIYNVPRFVRNILSCDGFITVSPNVADWLEKLCLQHHKQFNCAPGYFSVPKTTFKTAPFSEAKVAYFGTNWDGTRHQNIFNLLSTGEYLRCYGPKKSWANYPSTLYGGEIPFDGTTTLAVYNQSALGLCIGHPIFDKEGIANNRMYEIAAAGALPICSQNTLVKSIYGNTVLYIDDSVSSQEIAQQIIQHVNWVRTNPEKAQLMAKQAHAVFNEQLSMEFYLQELLKLHARALNTNFYTPIQSPKTSLTSRSIERIAYIINANSRPFNIGQCLYDIKAQTYPHTHVYVLVLTNDRCMQDLILQHPDFHSLNIHFQSYEDTSNNAVIVDFLEERKIGWFSILNTEDRLFKNHTATLLTLYPNYSGNLPVHALFSGYLEYMDNEPIQEKMVDEHTIANENNARVGSLTCDTLPPCNAIAFNTKFLKNAVLSTFDFNHPNINMLFQQHASNSIILESCQITCAAHISYLIKQKLSVHNNDLLMLLEDLPEGTAPKDILKKYKQRHQQQTAAINSLQVEVNSLQEKIQEIYASRSWRCTAPLRKITELKRKIKS